MKTKNKLHLAICFMAVVTFSTTTAQTEKLEISRDVKESNDVNKKQFQNVVKIINPEKMDVEEIINIDSENVNDNVKEISVIKGNEVITITVRSLGADSENKEKSMVVNTDIENVNSSISENDEPIALNVTSDEFNTNEKITIILKSNPNVNVMNKQKVKYLVVQSNVDETGNSFSEKQSTENVEELSAENNISISVTGDEQTSVLKPTLNSDVNSIGPGAKVYSFTALSTDEKLNKIKKAYVIVTKNNDNKVEQQQEKNDDIQKVEGSLISTAEEMNQQNAVLKVDSYPNPSNGLFTLKIQSQQQANAIVEINDISGKNVSTEELNGIYGEHTHTVDLSAYPKGVYFVTVKQGNNIAKMQAVVE